MRASVEGTFREDDVAAPSWSSRAGARACSRLPRPASSWSTATDEERSALVEAGYALPSHVATRRGRAERRERLSPRLGRARERRAASSRNIVPSPGHRLDLDRAARARARTRRRSRGRARCPSCRASRRCSAWPRKNGWKMLADHLRRHAEPVVAHHEDAAGPRPIRRRLVPHLDQALRLRRVGVLDGVREQVHQHQLEARRIDVQRRHALRRSRS